MFTSFRYASRSIPAFQKLFLLLAASLLYVVNASAQSCECDITLSNTDRPDGGIYTSASQIGADPGDVICLQAGTYKFIQIFDLQGTASQPITLKNCGGRVRVTGYSFGMSLTGARHVRVTGSGSNSFEYGLLFEGQAGSAIGGWGSFVEFDHIEVKNTGYAGILWKRDPSCDPTTWRENYLMQKIVFRDNYVHHTGGEGLYIGNTLGSTRTLNCGGQTLKKWPHQIDTVHIYRNRFEHCGWDGFQVSQVVKEVLIYDNVVTNYGTKGVLYQNVGIQLGMNTVGRVYNNVVHSGTGTGMTLFGHDLLVYNNVLVNAGDDGIFCDDRMQPVGTLGRLPGSPRYRFVNNTIVNPAADGISLFSDNSTGNIFRNNIVTSPGAAYVHKLNGNVALSQTSNLLVSSTAAAGFLNPSAKDYRLLANSPAVDAGQSTAAVGVTTDFDGTPRPQGSAYDIGAFEHPDGGASNISPTVTGGEDQIVSLPVASVQLTATASDANGTIVSYQWQKVAGPALSLTGQSSATLTVGDLNAGVYQLSVRVTDNGGATARDTVQLTVVAAPDQAVTSLTLINASTGQDIGSLTDGQVVDYGSIGTTEINVRANTSLSAVGSVQFTLNGALVRTENVAPYALYGDVNQGASYLGSTPAPGSYTLTATPFTAAGGSGQAGEALTVSFTIVETTSNEVPIANAGPDQTVSASGGTATFNGAYSTDPDGQIVQYAWNKVQGPGATLQGANTAALTASGLQVGSYAFRLGVTDNDGAVAYDTVQLIVTAPATPPTSSGNMTYAYYHGTWNELPNFGSLNPFKTGTVDNFTLAPRERNQQFAFVFEGSLQVSAPGEYTFFTLSDDGSKLYIDGEEVVDNDGLHGPRERSGSVTLAVGSHPIRVTFFEKGGGQVLQVMYQGPNITKQPIPTVVLGAPPTAPPVQTVPPAIGFVPTEWGLTAGTPEAITIEATPAPGEASVTWNVVGLPDFMVAIPAGNILSLSADPVSAGAHELVVTAANAAGLADTAVIPMAVEAAPTPPAPPTPGGQLTYRYYEGSWNVLPDFGELTPVTVGQTPGIDLSLRERENNFALTFEGFISIPVAGSYTFETNSDDGSKLYVNGEEVVDNDGGHGPRFREGTVNLTAGTHPFLVTYFEKTGGQMLEVYWKNTAHGVANRQLIPATQYTASGSQPPSSPGGEPPLPPTPPVAQTVMVNFNQCCAVVEAPWNNTHNIITGVASAYDNLLDTDGATTSWDLTLSQVSGSSSYNASGSTTGDNSGVYPDAVMQTAFWTADQVTFTLSELDPAYTYSLTFFGSRAATNDRSTAYTANGETVVVDAASNTQMTGVIEGIAPDANGQITFTMGKANASAYGYLNALVITGTAATAGRGAMPPPPVFTISKAFPNPFRDQVSITVNSENTLAGKLTISLVDQYGQPVYTEASLKASAKGKTTRTIDLRNVKSNAKLFVLVVSSSEHTERMILLRR